MKKLFCLFFITVTLQLSYSQKVNCLNEDIDSATMTKLPWFNNNTWLDNFVDTIEAPFNCTNCRLGDGLIRTLYQIPINAVVYDDVNYPNISDAQVEQYINYVNNFYKDNGVLIHFYLKCAIKRIGTSIHAYIDDFASNAETGIVLASDNETDCINVHFVHSAPYNGIARLPWMSLKYSCIIQTYNGFFHPVYGTDFRNSLAHELGHCLGLPHTFNKNDCRNDCWQECVSRTRTQENKCLFTAGSRKCEVNGDCFCDTDADVEKKDSYIQSYSCTSVTFTNDANSCKKTDNYGVNFFSNGFNNALKNLMSYWHGCRTKISKMQRGAMYIYSTKKGIVLLNNNNSSFYTNVDVDAY